MTKRQIKRLIEARIREDGVVKTGVNGVQLFRVTSPVRCAPAVYEPCLVAIVSGAKEAVLDAKHYVYDSAQYMCCPISMPVEAGTPDASPENPLLGVYISLDTRVMSELAIALESVSPLARKPVPAPVSPGLAFAKWDDAFTETMLRLLQVLAHPEETAILGDSRLREVYYAVLKGAAGASARAAFGVGNEIARAIEYMTTHLDEPVTIQDMAAQSGMSRAAFHRKFKQATTLSPIQFVKSMRLNSAAMQIAGGKTVNTAALEAGYLSASQFSREFKRMYGQSPKQWGHASTLAS